MTGGSHNKRILITGGAGFIGSALVRHLIAETDYAVLVIDKLTYAGHLSSLATVIGSSRFQFIQADICDHATITRHISDFAPGIITHLAAESHVDRSVDGPAAFIETNVMGTFSLLQATLDYWRSLSCAQQQAFRFHHISTDEVFGTLGAEGCFTEASCYDPRSPYAASKAGSDHLVRAWHHSYGLPVLLTNCSNNYGPYHFPEKLIPLMIIKCLRGEDLPIYGDGSQVRDWLFVDDHVAALRLVFERGRVGETYMIGGRCERSNLSVADNICDALDRMVPRSDGNSYRSQIRHVADRPGHDARYAVDPSKLERELGWVPRETFDNGIVRTIGWFLEHREWWEGIMSRSYDGRRLGLGTP